MAFIPELPEYSIERPKTELIQFLRLVYEYIQKSNQNFISKAECLELLMESHMSNDFKGKKPKDYNKLNNRYILPLISLRYLTNDDQNRGKM